MSRCGPTSASLILLGAMWTPVGCNDASGPWMARPFDPGIRASTTVASASSWPFVPASMRIHPLTRQVDSGGAGAVASASAPRDTVTDIEVRVEFLDADGFEIRAVGVIWLELRFADEHWSVGPIDLGDLELNRRLFEGVTRTYRLGVTLPPGAAPAPGEEIRIRATVRLPDERTLQDSIELPWR